MRFPTLVGFALPVLTLSLLGSCKNTPWGSISPGARPYDDLSPPGYFDIGVGYGVAFDTRTGSDDDAQGMVASLKAYPFGRWYGELKDEVVARDTNLSVNARRAFQEVADLLERRRKLANGLVEQIGRDDLKDFEREQLRGEIEAGVDAATPTNAAATATALAAKATAVPVSRTLTTAEQSALETQVLSGLTEFLGATRNLRAAFPDVGDLKSIRESDIDALDRFARFGKDEAHNWVVIEERASWWNRFSVFYGISAGKFSGGGIDSPLNVVGIGYDVSPDLALMLGWSFYESAGSGSSGPDADSSLLFGVSVNLYSFKRLLSAAKDI